MKRKVFLLLFIIIFVCGCTGNDSEVLAPTGGTSPTQIPEPTVTANPSLTDCPTPTETPTMTPTTSLSPTPTMTPSPTPVSDTEPPVLIGVEDRVVEIGGTIAYRKNVQAIDSCDGEVEFDVDSSRVNRNVIGEYPVIYSATDAAGNTVVQEAKVQVVEAMSDYEELYEKLEEIKAQNIAEDATMLEQARSIYDYMQQFRYTGYSDKTNWVSAALDGVRTKSGDCFTTFIISKLLLDMCNIPNLDVQRLYVEGDASTHFWSIVNCGDGWYFFDAGYHSVDYPFDGFMFTDAERAAYCELRGKNGYFYRYDSTLYEIEVVKE